MTRMGIGFDSHRLAKGRRFIIGGVHVPHDLGLDGHSDADVLCHAIIDALLGSIAAGDIGRHFPDTDPQWKDASSIDLLKATLLLLNSFGVRVVNIDSTVIAEAPKLAPYIELMRDNLATAVGIDRSAISVKAKTSEKMGALGRGEGVAVMAIASVESKEQKI